MSKPTGDHPHRGGLRRQIKALEKRVAERTGERLSVNRRLNREIEERVATEDALRTSEEKFSMAFHSSPDAIVISRLNDGCVLEINEGFTRISGYQRDEVIGRTTADLNLWVDLRDREQYVQLIATAGRARNREYRFRVKSGELRYGILSGETIQIGPEKCLLGTSGTSRNASRPKPRCGVRSILRKRSSVSCRDLFTCLRKTAACCAGTLI